VWDLGANTGGFSRLAAGMGSNTLAFDIDPAAVELNYRQVKQDHEVNLLPLVMDFTNPSPALGWHNRERQSLSERASAQVVMALALIHHLAISNNVPLARLAGYLWALGHWLIIEWVPKEDPQVQKLLGSRRDIFSDYRPDAFEAAFGEYFKIHDKVPLAESPRLIYLMERK
jgi:ribosomal protein L11 methylase PrmA